ncbi:MAG: alpha/beta hydrolase family esterase [Cyclobacteriaceae bacterium]
MMTRTPFLAILFLLLACQSNSTEDAAPPVPYPVGLTDQQITVNNTVRKFRIHRPAGDAPTALVFIFHGGGGAGTDVANEGTHPLWFFRQLADIEKFVAVYPEGSLDAQNSPGWNDCRSDDKSGSQGDDITFLKALVDKLSADFKMPASRLFVTGTSNGAVMAYRFAFTHATSFRALAISAGNLPALPEGGACTSGPASAIPIMIAYGTADPAMPVAGGCVANLGGQCNRGTVVSQQATANFWLAKNGLTGVQPTVSTFDVNKNDAGDVVKHVYAGANPMVIYWMTDAGHSVPSKTVFTAPSAASGVQNRDIEFAEEAWAFFKARL